MSRIVHLSDLHFGRDRPELEDPLLAKLEEIDPDLVVISGDFTQRARVSQYEEARRFVERIGPRVIAVPGNHDTPLDNLWVRFVRPWARYRAAIDRELEPTFSDNSVVIVGVNTVNRFSWQRGKIGRHTVDRVCRAFDGVERRTRIAVMHHPLEHGPDVDKRLMQGSNEALRRLEACGTDLVLSGHLHNASAAPFTNAPGLLFVQAGTGLSTRLRGEANTFNLIEAEPGLIHIDVYSAGESPTFEKRESASFYRTGHGWAETPSDEPKAQRAQA
ncbi:metallophosphoesterase family protein [Pelagovum pacificum]|uniref:Metallophosphoesterase n=1 Tax=Pelagovum pacificum TaxID=2588711 RepID=A0A5C5GGY8_9RHOB|nr:metallophosphoesterase family protein [Pelagovum pacificum]QQA42823.1 metallophosphoesterase [Pelagovum pacificum]TNY34028.1 metallophosphoesterase [Pelagovum pacificum]